MDLLVENINTNTNTNKNVIIGYNIKTSEPHIVNTKLLEKLKHYGKSKAFSPKTQDLLEFNGNDLCLFIKTHFIDKNICILFDSLYYFVNKFKTFDVYYLGFEDRNGNRYKYGYYDDNLIFIPITVFSYSNYSIPVGEVSLSPKFLQNLMDILNETNIKILYNGCETFDNFTKSKKGWSQVYLPFDYKDIKKSIDVLNKKVLLDLNITVKEFLNSAIKGYNSQYRITGWK